MDNSTNEELIRLEKLAELTRQSNSFDHPTEKHQELLEKKIIEKKDDLTYLPRRHIYRTIRDIINTKGIEFIKFMAQKKSIELYNMWMIENKIGLHTEYECLIEIKKKFKLDSRQLRYIKAIENSDISQYIPKYFSLDFFYDFFINEKRPSPLELWIFIQNAFSGAKRAFIGSYSEHLVLLKCNARLEELENEKTSNDTKEVINSVDIIENIVLKHSYAFMYKLGIIEQINENAEVVLKDADVAKIISQILNKTDPKEIENIRTYHRDAKHRDKKKSFWNKSTNSKMAELKAKYGLTYFDE